ARCIAPSLWLSQSQSTHPVRPCQLAPSLRGEHGSCPEYPDLRRFIPRPRRVKSPAAARKNATLSRVANERDRATEKRRELSAAREILSTLILPFGPYGRRRFSSRGNGIVSRRCSMPQIQVRVSARHIQQPLGG